MRGAQIAPVEIVHARDHRFVKPPKGSRGCRHDTGGKACGRAKLSPLHYGAVPSLNESGSGANHFAYQNAKKALEQRLIELLDATPLPRGLAKVTVEGQMCFPDRGRRDQGNFRYFVEKCLGDALVTGGWIEDDDWDRYEFGGLEKTYQRGVSWTRLIIFAYAAVVETDAGALDGWSDAAPAALQASSA